MMSNEFQEILFKLKQSKLYYDMKRKVSNELQNTKQITILDIQTMAQSCEVEETLKKLITNLLKKSRKAEPIIEDQIEILNHAKHRWTDLIFKNLEIVHSKFKHQEEDECNKDSKFYIYDDKNLLMFLTTIKNQMPNLSVQSNKILQVMIPLKSYQSLFDRYRYLLIKDELNEEKIQKIKKNIESETLEPELENIAMGYVPNGDRCLLYLKYFELDHSDIILQQHYNKLVKDLKQNEQNNFYDDLIELDVNEITEDTNYFVFREQIIQLLRCFCRDKSIKDSIRIHFQGPKSNQNHQEFHYPPCGFLPFRHLSKYVAPFCYLSTKAHIIYSLFKEFFIRYLCFLHSISSNQNSILSLALQVEEIISFKSPKLLQHLRSINQDCIKIVVHQMMYCFVGWMETQQILHVFDKILAHNSLEILIILAIGFLQKYKPKLLLAKHGTDVEKIFQEYREDLFYELIDQAYKQ